MTDTLIEKVAKSDAEFDGRSWLGMPSAERKRYRARAVRSVAIVAGELAERPHKEANAVMKDAPVGDVGRINHAIQVSSTLVTEAELLREECGIPCQIAWEEAEEWDRLNPEMSYEGGA